MVIEFRGIMPHHRVGPTDNWACSSALSRVSALLYLPTPPPPELAKKLPAFSFLVPSQPPHVTTTVCVWEGGSDAHYSFQRPNMNIHQLEIDNLMSVLGSWTAERLHYFSVALCIGSHCSLIPAPRPKRTCCILSIKEKGK